MRTPPSLLVLVLAACSSAPPAPDDRPVPVDEAPVRDGLNDNFLADDLQIQEWLDRFEVESREIAARRNAILAAMAVQPSEELADVGAGTGLFLEPFSFSAGEHGKVYAVEISTGFVDHLRERAAREQLENVEVVLCTERDCMLPEGSVDTIFVCDTYHHFTYPRTTLSTLHRALRPGGELFVVDFERIPGVSREWTLGHVRAGKEEVIAEIEDAGFVLEEELEVGLVENYMLRFRR